MAVRSRATPRPRLLAEFLAEEKFDAIYSSPRRRAMQTVEPIAAERGMEIIPLDGLAEFDKHSDEYLFFDDLQKAGDPRYKACLRGDLSAWNTDYPTFRAEVMEAVTEITAKHVGERVLVASHGGALNTMLGAVLGLDRMWFFYPEAHRHLPGRGRPPAQPDADRHPQRVQPPAGSGSLTPEAPVMRASGPPSLGRTKGGRAEPLA